MEQATVIAVDSKLDGGSAGTVLRQVESHVRRPSSRLVLDVSGVDAFDSAGMAGVVEALRRARAAGIEVRLKGPSAAMLQFLSLVSVQRLSGQDPPRHRPDPVTRLGALALPALVAAREVAGLLGRVLVELAISPLRRALRLDRTAAELDVAALGALPIVGLIGFLLGLILAMQAYGQLRVWGAEIYIADMVAVSVVTEIGPLLTAIVLAARSGSSNAAQLGAMVVNEEVDALRQMGVSPLRFLVVPKVLALLFAAVGLCLVFDLVALAGGGLFAVVVAGIEPAAYREQTRQALRIGELCIALGKAGGFGLLIGAISCGLGLRVAGGSAGVARATTAAVVAGIFLVIVLDAAFVAVQRMVLG